ncbi:CPSF A subunit region-domain-containing protein [Chaetomium tenue]|uniref:CPSF A subunit region-domain-containing protein n=1 Tax=Chaetomium tenue TaxID=1854479 RepID=A0ACB7P0F3_9PEZI|nr:CPSF A subunit region-domain-containing protein [Chaetomium globosum]
MATTSNMFLYSLTIQPPTAITQAIVGLFSVTKEQQILTASGSRLTLLCQDANLGRLSPLITQDLFGTIRSIAAFRLAGSAKDYILLATDSGRIAVLEYLAAQNRFSRGRACLIASIEKSKLVYVLNRNAEAELTISSPLEAHKSGTLVFSLVALDVGYSNPVFASLETDYSGLDQNDPSRQHPDVELVYYELDLGLNHIVRKWSEPVDPTSSLLFQVPGGNDGPSGVLGRKRRGATEDPQRKRTIVSGVMHKLKNSPEAFFFLLQTEDGDLFKATLVPVAKSLCILKSGFLFVASEFGNHHLYQFEKLGDGQVEFSSDKDVAPVFFDPQPSGNLSLVETIESMNPILASDVVNLREEDDAPQIYSACGSGARSYFRILKHGLEVNEIVASELPGTVSAVWTAKLTNQDKHDTYIILSSSTDTLILSIGEEVKQVNDSGFLTSVGTLAIQQIGNDSLVQVHPKGIRHIRSSGQIIEWPVPQHRSIVAAATNQRQVAVALSSGEIVYFELDDADGSLAEYDRREEMSGTVTCLGLGQVPNGRLRSSFLAVGCDDRTIRILSLDPESTLESRSVQALTATPSSLAITQMEDSSLGRSNSLGMAKTTYLHIGLHSGVYLRTVLEETTGSLTDTEHKFLGVKPVRLFPVTVQQKPCVLALSSKSWMGYVDPTRGFMVTPLSYENLDWGWSFSSEQCEEGIIGVHGNHLRIFSVESLYDNLTHKSVPLTYTPRHLVKHPNQPYFYTIESENNTLAPELRAQLVAADTTAPGGDVNEPGHVAETLPPEQFGYPRGQGRWASCINIIDPIGEKVLQTIHFQENEAATSLAVVPFTSQGDESFLVVGTGKDMVLNPRRSSGGYIYVYRFHEDGRDLEFIHKTKTTEPPTALAAFRGQLAAGIGKTLLIYDLGLKQLLRKAQANDVTPGLIVSLQTQGNRIALGDVQHGVAMVTYRAESNQLIPFVDDTIARWTTCMTMIDYDSVAGGDKFGNFWVHLHGAPHRLDLTAHFHTQDIPTRITKTHLVVGGQEVLVWSGFRGTIGVFIPFVTREDADFFLALEQHMRGEEPSLFGRDHVAYRGYYVPAKGVIDGDLCERYRLLPGDKKQRIAAELDRSVREVGRKISDARSRSAF